MKLKTNVTKQVLRDGGTCIGTMVRLAKSPLVVPLCSEAGWDYMILDTEHNDYDPETLAVFGMVAKYEDITLLVRVPDKWYFQIAQTLDFGVEGLVLPRVESRAQVDRIIQSAKFHPLGSRGANISMNVTRFREVSLLDYMEWANEHILVVIQIESREAVNNLDELLSREGIDAVMIGPSDLSQDFGIPGQSQHPLMEEAFEKVIEACDRYGVAPGIHLADITQVVKWVKRGMRFLTYSYDTKLLADSSRQAAEKLRSILGPNQSIEGANG